MDLPPPGPPPPGVILPAMPPPPGVTPNFVNPPSSSHQIVVVAVFFTILAGLFVGFRIYTRAVLLRKVGSDDLIETGLGVDQWNVPLRTFSPYFLRYLYASTLIQNMLPAFAKLSILLLYLRIFAPTARMRWAIIGCITFIAAYTTAVEVGSIFGCTPVSMIWDITQHGRCIDGKILGITAAVLNALADLIILLLPIPGLMQLQMAPRQKVALLAIFLTGGFVTAVSIVRLKVYVVDTFGKRNLTKAVMTTIVWCIVEANVSIVVASVMTLKPFVRHFFPTLLELPTRAKGSKKVASNDVTGGARSLTDSSKTPRATAWVHAKSSRDDGASWMELEAGDADADVDAEFPRKGAPYAGPGKVGQPNVVRVA
ncbi:MAG: hypothetical protein M1826_006906 [Phylliscum demangeonii]|nr:MAG: hypothetical protein M1826_006906 [Phylliscum demangeonii]